MIFSDEVLVPVLISTGSTLSRGRQTLSIARYCHRPTFTYLCRQEYTYVCGHGTTQQRSMKSIKVR